MQYVLRQDMEEAMLRSSDSIKRARLDHLIKNVYENHMYQKVAADKC